jgi:molecular chaperone DnaJ
LAIDDWRLPIGIGDCRLGLSIGDCRLPKSATMDYYAILGLERGASAADIKRAYRRLARRHHPGINPGDRQAEVLFERISEAYETLVDPERRRRYDSAGVPGGGGAERGTFEFSGFDFSAAAHGAQAATFTELFAEVLHPLPKAERRAEAGADLHAGVSLSFEDALRGVTRQVVVTRQVLCGACRGAGEISTVEMKCAQCQGAGKVRWARGHMVFTKVCPSCRGAGRERQRRCAMCAGQGRAVRSEAVSVRIPPGARDGERLRIPEAGHAGRLGGRNGDLYVDVAVRPHPVLRREGDDLHMAVPIAVHEAALGARIEVPSVDGPLSVKVPPGTQAGQRLRLSGRGAPGVHGERGDLYIEVRLALPPLADERSKELMRELARLNPMDVRRGLMEKFTHPVTTRSEPL